VDILLFLFVVGAFVQACETLLGIPAALVAGYKGFAPFRWLVALSPIGLIVVICLSSAGAAGISAGESATRVRKSKHGRRMDVWAKYRGGSYFVDVGALPPRHWLDIPIPVTVYAFSLRMVATL
jgi:hypothetical protein